ncbi:MAG: hypothetical protein HDT38_06505 [Clostridiales bacterium]|nr:hypothetical protein [Clostridiales bacterium]
MSQIYLNSPSVGRPISAEEFAAGTLQSGCGCGGAASDCPGSDCGQGQECCQQMICCCHPVPTQPEPPEVDEACCCKQSFRAALGLLCDERLSSLLDFDTSAFLTNTYVAGATLDTAAPTDTPADNLSAALTGSFRRFSPCGCDLLDVEAPVYNAAGTQVLTATQVSLCQLDAVVLQGAEAAAEGDLSSEEVATRNFRCLRQRLAQRLSPCGNCGQEQCSCGCDERDCCCAAGLLATLAQNNLSRRVSLAAGLLVLTGVTLLGTVGSVLVLANDTDRRLYFVCVNSVQFIG